MARHLARIAVGADRAAVSVEPPGGGRTALGIVDIGPDMFNHADRLLTDAGYTAAGDRFHWHPQDAHTHVAAADLLWDR